MEGTSQDLKPEATTCPHQPNTKSSSILLDKEISKRPFCTKCFDEIANINFKPPQERVPSESILQHQDQHDQNRIKPPQDGLEPTCNSRHNDSIIQKMMTEPIIHVIKSENYSLFSCFSVSLDSKWLVTAANGDSVKIWDLKTQTLYHTYNPEYEDSFDYIEILKDCNHILLVSDAAIAIWSIQDKKLLLLNKPTSKVGKLLRVAKVSPDDKVIATGGLDGFIKIWKKSDLSLILEGSKAHEGCDGEIYCLAFHPHLSQYLISGDADGKVVCWDVQKKLSVIFVVKTSFGRVNAVQFDPTGKNFILSSNNGDISLWDFTTRKMIHYFKAHDGNSGGNGFCMIPGGSDVLCSYGMDDAVKIWNIEDSTHPELLNTFSDTAIRYLLHRIGASQNGTYIVVSKDKFEIAILDFSCSVLSSSETTTK